MPRYAVFDGIRAVFSSGFLLFRFLKLDQPWLHHDFFGGHEPYAQAVQELGQHDLGGQLQRRRAAELRASVRVHVRAHHRQLRRGQLGERRALGDHLAQLDVVLLAAAFLARLHRIAVVHATARAPRRAAFLDDAVVQELRPPVGENDAEQPLEFPEADQPLDHVERLAYLFLVVFRQEQHELEPESPEQQGQDRLDLAAPSYHAIHLDGVHLFVIRKGLEALVCAPLQVMPGNRGLIGASLPWLEAHLLWQVQPDDVAEHPHLDIAVERAQRHGQLAGVGGPNYLGALPLLDERPDDRPHRLELLGRDVDAFPRLDFPLLRELVGHPAVVEPVFVAAPHSVAPVAAVARERRLREPRALVREEIRADLVAHRRPARRARHQAALAAHVPLRARLPPQAYVARLDGQEAGARRHPVALYLAGHGRRRDAQPPGDFRQRPAVLELLLDRHAVPLGELPVLASRHSLHLPSPECRLNDGIRWDSGGEQLLSETKCTERAFQIRIKHYRLNEIRENGRSK